MTTHITESQTTRHNARESDLQKKKKVTTASDSQCQELNMGTWCVQDRPKQVT